MFTILGADGKEYGPVTAGKIAEWIAGGRANLQTKARRAGETDWRTLGDYPEFNPSAPPPLTVDTGVAPPVPAAAAVPAPELAGRGVRLGAYLLDYFIGVLAALPGLIMMGPAFLKLMLEASQGHEPDINTIDLSGMMLGLLVLCAGSFILLIVQIVMISTRGQSLGKRLLGIRIVRYPDQAPAGFVHGWLLRSFVTGIISALPWIGMVFFIVDSCLIFGAERRCVHDLIAGTQVVKA